MSVSALDFSPISIVSFQWEENWASLIQGLTMKNTFILQEKSECQ
jgi:hypothetical protein